MLDELLNPAPLLAVVFTYTISLLLAPWSLGIVFFLIFIYVGEAINGFRCYNSGGQMKYNAKLRAALILAAFLGWLTGRILMNDFHPLDTKKGTRKWNYRKADLGRELVKEYSNWDP